MPEYCRSFEEAEANNIQSTLHLVAYI